MNETDHVEKQDVENAMSLLWLPYVTIALVFIVFLGVSFLRYHLRHRERYERKISEMNTKERQRQRTIKLSNLKSRGKVDSSLSLAPNITNERPAAMNTGSQHMWSPSSDERILTNGERERIFPHHSGFRESRETDGIYKFRSDNKMDDGSFRASGEFIFCDSELNNSTPPQQRVPNCWKKQNDINNCALPGINATTPVWIASEHFDISSISTSSELLFGASSNHR